MPMLHGREFYRKSEHANTCKKFCEHEQASTHLIFASNSSKGQILRALSNLMARDHSIPVIMLLLSMEAIHKYLIPASSLNSVFITDIFHRISHSILLRMVDLCFILSSDFKYYLGFVVEEIFEVGLVFNLEFSTLKIF